MLAATVDLTSLPSHSVHDWMRKGWRRWCTSTRQPLQPQRDETPVLKAIAGDGLVIDADLRTLHIRCGSDIRDKLSAAGFGGDFLEYSDAVCEGPVPDLPDLTRVRAHYLARAYGRLKQMSQAEMEARLREEEHGLMSAHAYERVVLWFEHDSYDQLLLARCLSGLAKSTLPARLELICIDHHPDVPRFNGLGQLEPAALAGLWPQRKAVTAGQIVLGQSIWKALRPPDPTGLQTIASTGTPALPIATPALWRHLRELPGTADGLSLTQRLVLTILSEAPTLIGRIFADLVNGREPLVFMGDTGLLGTVEAMARTVPPVLMIEPGEKPFPRKAWITDVGLRVLSGAVDYLSLGPEERWIGGVRITDAQTAWRFDENEGRVVASE